MNDSGQKGEGKQKVNEIKTFPVPFPLGEKQANLTIKTNTPAKPSKEQIINQAFKFHSQGNISEAVKLYQYFINQGFKDHRAFSNYGVIFKNLGKLQEAELSTRKAIELNPNLAEAHSNLGNILSDLGNLKDAELSTRKAIELNPDYAEAHSNLGNILRDLGNLKDAELSTRKAIELNPNLAEAHSNLGNILSDLGKLQDAELSTRKAIELNPDYAEAHSNLGNILRDLGNLKDAELSTRKAIELNPNLAEAHSNLGNILSDLGKLQDAELSTRKAIELNPDYAEAHSNLGNILRDLGSLQEAELSTRKAIKLNPDYAMAHNNLGTILNDLGNLKDAELSTRKAIELNPDYAEAHSNLGTILNDLGKLEALILLSKSIPETNSFNQGYNLITTLEITIANLLRGDFSATYLNINKTNELINQGLLDMIKKKENRKNTLNYSRLIASLYPLLKKEHNNPNSSKIPHIGESHCLSFAHQTLSISSQLKQIQPVLIKGGKAWHFANNNNNQWKDSLTQQIKNHNYSDEIFISFGEIDCRKDEGILNYAIKNDKDISEVCKKTIKGYMGYMEQVLSPTYSKKYYFGIPAPTRKQELLDDLDLKRIEMIKIYNSLLKQEVLGRGSYFLDVYKLTSNENGENNNFHMCDKVHLSPKCLSILFKNHLYEPNSVIQ